MTPTNDIRAKMGMKSVELKKGDPVWFYMGDHGGKLTKGTIVEARDIDGYGFHYIIAVATGIDDILEVRDPYTVTDSPDRPLGWLRR